jgi:HAD superfamily hydrolase (TIGR01509 family)
MIRTVVSDLGNVLLHFDHMLACRRLAERCGWSPQEIYDSMFTSGLVAEYDLGRISSAEFGRRSMERLAVVLEMGEIRQIWSDIFDPVEGMEELVRALKGRYALVLLSNTNKWHFEHCHARFPVVRLFEHFALSYRLRCQKPDPAVYREALAMAGALPEETLYVDDIPAYVESARRLGMKAICFQDREHLIKDMRSEGIICP